MPLQLTWRDIPKSEAIEAEIRTKTEKLNRFYDNIINCRVVVEPSHRRHYKGNLYRIRINIDVPNKEIVVTRNPSENRAHEDIYVVIRDAFDEARRQLQDYARIRRGQVKRHDAHHVARVLSLEPQQDYGFLKTVDGREIYFHRNALINVELEKLKTGAEVMYVEEEGREGPQAAQVSIGKHHVPEKS